MKPQFWSNWQMTVIRFSIHKSSKTCRFFQKKIEILSRKFSKLKTQSNWVKTTEATIFHVIKIRRFLHFFQFRLKIKSWLINNDSSLVKNVKTKPEMEVSAYESVLIVNVCYVALLCGNMQFILDWQLCNIAQGWYEITSTEQGTPDGSLFSMSWSARSALKAGMRDGEHAKSPAISRTKTVRGEIRKLKSNS